MPDGALVPGSLADREELLALSDGVRRAGHGPVQFMCDMADWDEQLRSMIELSCRSDASVHFTLTDKNWQAKLAAIESAPQAGARLVGDVAPRAIGNILQWRASRHPFMDRPSIRKIARLPWQEQIVRLKDPAFRAQVLSEDNGDAEKRQPEYARAVYRAFDRMYEIEDFPKYEPDPKTDSIAARAAAQGKDAMAYAYDVMTGNDGEGMIYMTIANYQAGDFSEIEKLISHPGTMVSLSDGGAHCTRIVDASAPTFMLAHWARDRSRGGKMPLSAVVKRCSHDTATAYGLRDRGVVAPGYLADLNVIDFDHLRLPAPYMIHDFPTGARRLLQAAEGYVATIKRGQITFRCGTHTGAFPGKLIRGPQASPGM
jgi:N-acyl-D-aspartate/D-glutamate deacylase